ncbi:hypothetical protein EKE94_08900 [Mesobaculum littorinae]|uniref:Uncharacterized protein n=1 Tax=Mesobaculum littorinae TaxID=2486419 RepID=A0A438AK19_9RHOB|nr:hypothetical protein [Mesobaculum littorinae]RVV98986.1 hypothetical protein EKE94_08900 [Mesobaculum littorinae]
MIETETGFVLRDPRAGEARWRGYDRLLAATGSALAIAVVALWWLPVTAPAPPRVTGPVTGPQPQAWQVPPEILSRLAISLALLGLAALLIAMGQRARVTDWEFDFDAGSAYRRWRIGRGQTGLLEAVALDRILAVRMHPRIGRADAAVLSLKVRRRLLPVVLSYGAREDMARLHRRIQRDLEWFKQPVTGTPVTGSP